MQRSEDRGRVVLRYDPDGEPPSWNLVSISTEVRAHLVPSTPRIDQEVRVAANGAGAAAPDHLHRDGDHPGQRQHLQTDKGEQRVQMSFRERAGSRI
jgi:hypothetical protein